MHLNASSIHWCPWLIKICIIQENVTIRKMPRPERCQDPKSVRTRCQDSQNVNKDVAILDKDVEIRKTLRPEIFQDPKDVTIREMSRSGRCQVPMSWFERCQALKDVKIWKMSRSRRCQDLKNVEIWKMFRSGRCQDLEDVKIWKMFRSAHNKSTDSTGYEKKVWHCVCRCIHHDDVQGVRRRNWESYYEHTIQRTASGSSKYSLFLLACPLSIHPSQTENFFLSTSGSWKQMLAHRLVLACTDMRTWLSVKSGESMTQLIYGSSALFFRCPQKILCSTRCAGGRYREKAGHDSSRNSKVCW